MWQLLCLPTPTAPTGVLMQSGPLEWIHLPATDKKIVADDPALIAAQIIKRKKRRIKSFDKNAAEIIISYNKITIKCFAAV